MTDRIEARRLIAATPAEVFTLLCDPQGHVAIDSSGMLQSADGAPVQAVGEEFVIHMDRESLGDRPMGEYDVTVIITAFEPARQLEWKISGPTQPPVNHRWGYRLDADGDATMVTSYCDWSQMRPEYRDRFEFPIVPQSALRATLGILARTLKARERA